MMHGYEQSDPVIVAMKPTNKAGQPVAEPVEPRAGAEGTAGRQSTLRAQNRKRVTQALGFITPLTHNFCESCNRVRLTCTGTLFMCLGQEDAADLRTPLRQSEGDEVLEAAILEAIDRKPKGHDFIIDRRHNRPAIARHMSVTGG
jgi:molybdenum cofactor biosynthesis enzyme MoaA